MTFIQRWVCEISKLAFPYVFVFLIFYQQGPCHLQHGQAFSESFPYSLWQPFQFPHGGLLGWFYFLLCSEHHYSPASCVTHFVSFKKWHLYLLLSLIDQGVG